MPTDDERRKVARKLRLDMDTQPCFASCDNDTARAVIRSGGTVFKACLIADLIEPATTCPDWDGECMAMKIAHPVDRDALLALADEMDIFTSCDDPRCGKVMPPLTVHDFARRVRALCGAGEEDE